MADATRGTVTELDTTWIRRQAIRTLEKKLFLADLATAGDLPEGVGSTLRWTFDDNLANTNAFNALTDDSGTPITFATRDAFNEEAFTVTQVETQIHTYGIFVPVRRKDLKQMTRGTLDRIGKRVGYRGAEVLDTLLRAALDGTGTAFNPSMGAGTTTTRKSIGDGTNDTTLSTADFLTAEDILLGWGDLEANDAEPFENGRAVAIVHSSAGVHLKTDVSSSRVTWFEAVKHVSGMSGQEKFLRGLIGDLGGVQVMVSNNITTATVDVPAYHNLIISDQGLGNVHQDDMNPTVHINRSGPQSMSDPHRMFATVAFNFQSGPTLIDVKRSEILFSTV